MLNLSERLILGCALAAGVAVWLGIVCHQPFIAAAHPTSLYE